MTRVPPILWPRVKRDHARAAIELDEDETVDANIGLTLTDDEDLDVAKLSFAPKASS